MKLSELSPFALGKAMGKCHCCLKETRRDFCPKCSRKLFGGSDFCATLDYNISQLSFSESGAIKRISLSGAQAKFSARMEGKRLVNTDRGGTHILKPSLQNRYDNFQDSPANEHVTMLMAKSVFKIPTSLSALLFLEDGNPVYVTKRFDVLENGERINQSDFAQIAGLVPEKNGSNYKYEGISYEEIAELIQKYVSAADVAVEVFFRTVLFNYLVCNGDAHSKNFSLRSTPEAPEVYELTPAYDLLNTSLHIPNEMSRMALDLFKDEDDFSTPFYEMNGFYGVPDFMEFAKRIGVVEKRAKRFIKQAVDSVPIMEAMLDDSFLSDSSKEKYKASVRDRAMALGVLEDAKMC